MQALVDKIRGDLNPSQMRRGLGRRRRIVASALAGVGLLLLVGALRPASPPPVAEQSISVAVHDGEVAVPITIRPAAIAAALQPGMSIDVVPSGQDDIARSPIVRDARVLRLPTSGFGPTSEAVVVVSVPEESGLRLASVASSGFSVIIRPTP